MKKLSLKREIQFFQDHFHLTRELRDSLATQNLKNLHTLLHFIFIYGFLGVIYEVVTNSFDIYSDRYEIYYYGMFIFISFLGIIFSAIVLRMKNPKYWQKLLPYNVSFVFTHMMVCYVICGLRHSFSGIILFICIDLVSILCLFVDPWVFTFSLVFTNTCCMPYLYTDFGKKGIFDMAVLSILLLCLSLYKRMVTKHDLLRTKMLEENRDVMQSAMADQIEEIQTKNEKLKTQHQKIINLQNNTIIGLSNLVENRDSDTGEHVRRTSAYVNLIALKSRINGYERELLSDEYINLLTKAAPMHDIGKIVVPDYVLKKPGRLTDEEFEQIKRHTTEGGRIVRELLGEGEDQNYVNMAIEVATCHHEHWDGTGYPSGLKGSDIPLSARIMAIADVFDALVSPRCYKEPFSVEKAMEIIKSGAGTHFDPELAEIFIGMEDDTVAVMEKYKD